MTTLLGISGALRRASTNTGLLRALKARVGDLRSFALAVAGAEFGFRLGAHRRRRIRGHDTQEDRHRTPKPTGKNRSDRHREVRLD